MQAFFAVFPQPNNRERIYLKLESSALSVTGNIPETAYIS
jgi:hypothetical protein